LFRKLPDKIGVLYKLRPVQCELLEQYNGLLLHTPTATRRRGTSRKPTHDGSINSISRRSPGCLAAGDGSAAFGADLDGEAWKAPGSNRPADDIMSGAVTGALALSIVRRAINDSSADFAIPESKRLFRENSGAGSSNYWDFGDGFFANDQPNTTHAVGLEAGPLHGQSLGVLIAIIRPESLPERPLLQIVDQPVRLRVAPSSPNPASTGLSMENSANNIPRCDLGCGGIGGSGRSWSAMECTARAAGRLRAHFGKKATGSQ